MSAASEPQAHRLASNPNLPPLAPESASEPRVLIPGDLIITREQEDAMLAHCKQRKDTLRGDLGLKDFEADNWVETGLEKDGTFKRRYLDTQQMGLMAYAMKYDWRAKVIGGLFAESNLHVPLTRRVLQQQIARAISYFTGTTPYFSAADVGAEDADASTKVNRWAQHVLETENATAADINAGIERAFVCSAAIYSLSYQRKVRFYQCTRDVLIVDSKAFIAQDGEYVIKGVDKFTADSTGSLVLDRDGVTPLPGSETYKSMRIWKKVIIKEGPKADLLNPSDFLFPLDAKSLDDADFLWHRTTDSLIQLVHDYQNAPGMSSEQILERASLLVQRLLPSSNNTPGASANQSRPDLGEPAAGLGRDTNEPQLNVDRFCIHYDANGDGNLEDILIIATEDGYPIAYDYVANFTPDARRPYRKLRINPIAGRIQGQGNAEMFEELQTNCDLFLNRWNFSQSGSGRVTLWRPHNTVEGRTRPNLKLNNGDTYTPLEGKSDADVLSYVTLPDLKGMDLKTMLEFFLQIAGNMSGVSNTNDAGIAGLAQTKLATGIREIQESGQELFGKYISDLLPDVKDLVIALIALAVADMDSPKAFKFFEGDVGAIAEMTPDELRDLSLDVEIELTKQKGEELAAQTNSAAALGKDFYALPPIVQDRLKVVFIQGVKAAKFKNAEEIIKPIPMNLRPEVMAMIGLGPPVTAPDASAPAAPTPPQELPL